MAFSLSLFAWSWLSHTLPPSLSLPFFQNCQLETVPTVSYFSYRRFTNPFVVYRFLVSFSLCLSLLI